MPNALIFAARRTPVGRAGGALASVRPDDLAAIPIKAVMEQTGFNPAGIDDVIFGCANQSGEDNRNVARMATLLSGLPISVPGQTVNRLCGSGLQAAASAAQAVKAGEGDAFVAGGVESMSRAPYVMLKPDRAFDRRPPTVADTTVGWRFTNPALSDDWTISLGATAEKVAAEYGVSREEQDAFAFESQQRAARALDEGVFADEIVPVEIPQRRGEPVTVETDEHPRPDVTLAKLGSMRPAFAKDGSVTAGNASGINDGAAALLIVSDAVTLPVDGGQPLARIIGTAVAGVEPSMMGIGPVPATRKVLDRYGMKISDIDLVELNEAFAAQAIPCIRELDLDPARVNIYGGAIALGHPLGCTGARLLTTLVHALHRTNGRYGLVSMCIGVGQGISMLVERA